jgi:hypothetical protein
MQRLNEISTVPPDGFRYFQPETRMTIRGGDYWDLFKNVKSHRVANSIPLSSIWKEEIEDQLCKTLPTGWCKEVDPNKGPAQGVLTRISWDDLQRGMATMINWAAEGLPYVEQGLAEERARICTRCYYNVNLSTGCNACRGIVNLVTRAARGRKTSADGHLKSCAICKCSNQAQVHFPIESLEKTTPNEMLSLFPDFCWKKQEVEAFRSQKVVPYGG